MCTCWSSTLFNIVLNLECTTKDLDLKCLQIIYNVMIKTRYNPNEDFRLKMCLDQQDHMSLEDQQNTYSIEFKETIKRHGDSQFILRQFELRVD